MGHREGSRKGDHREACHEEDLQEGHQAGRQEGGHACPWTFPEACRQGRLGACQGEGLDRGGHLVVGRQAGLVGVLP